MASPSVFVLDVEKENIISVKLDDKNLSVGQVRQQSGRQVERRGGEERGKKGEDGEGGEGAEEGEG